MQVNIIIFGHLIDIVGTDNISISGITDTDELIKEMSRRFPALADKKYRIAVNRKIITDAIILQDDNAVALLPPFSGG